MAGTPQNQLKNSLFPPSLFDDPDTISQIAQVEAPQSPQVTPGDQANVPMDGMVPKTFLDWHADPINVAKVAPPIPPGTPMPSVIAAKVQSAIQPQSDITPPFSPDVAGSPEAQLYGTPAPQAAPVATPQSAAPGLMKNVPAAPTLESSLMSGPPAPQAPSGPLNKADFLAQNPVKIPGAPYVPHGGKLALTGLFAALDNAGAFLDHGTPTVGPGLIKNAQALQEYNANLPATQQQSEQAAYDEYLKNYGSARQNTLTAMTVQGPNGPVTMYADPATQKAYLPAATKAGATVQAANIGAQSRMDVKQLELAVQQGNIDKMIPGVNPENGRPQYELFNKAGKSLGFADNSVVPGLMSRSSSTVEYKEDGDGVMHVLPKTTISAPMIPGSGARAPLTPPKQAAPAATPQGKPPVSAGAPVVQNAAPGTPQTPSAPPAAGGGKIVPGFLGKAAKETGTAYDPKSDSYYVTTRADANTNGYQNFTKSTAAEQEKDRETTNQLSDVQTKLDRYQKTFANNLSDQDKTNLAALTSDNEFKVGMFGTELPTGWLKKITSTNAFQALSPEGQARFLAYGNAREAMAGYQKALTGSSRGNEKTLQLQLDTLADPTWTPQAATGAFNQFNENIRTIGRGLPKMPGIPNADAIHNQNQPGAAAGIPAGAKVRDYTALGR